MRRIASTFKPYLIYASAFVTFAVCLAGCEEGGGLSPEVKLRIDNIVECEMLEKLIPGVSISVVKNGKTLYRRGYGKADIGAGTDVRPDTKFALGSVTKVFTAIGVLNLYDRGLVDLDEEIGTYLPDLPNGEWKVRTVRDLLSMSSGIAELALCDSGPKEGEACEDHPLGTPYVYNLSSRAL